MSCQEAALVIVSVRPATRPARRAISIDRYLVGGNVLFRRMLHPCRVDGGSNRTSFSMHGLGYLLTALRRQRLIPDELVLQVATFLRSHDLFLELRVRTPRTLTANQVRQGGKQGTDGREHSGIHFSACPALISLLRASGPKINYFF
jgi:hypothetical protein